MSERRKPTPGTRVERVLDVLDPELWTTQADVRQRAVMDMSSCLRTLESLVERGEVEFSRLLRGPGKGGGRPQHLYRLAVRNRKAAA